MVTSSSKSINPSLQSPVQPLQDPFARSAAPQSETSNLNTLVLFSLFAEKTADKSGELSTGSITSFITMLEMGGIDTTPIRQMIEKVSGQPYSAFFSGSPDSKISAADFYDYNRSGMRVPHIKNPGFDSDKAIRIARFDNAGSGYCARGTANILQRMGMSVQRGNATHWDDTLPKNGWVRLQGATPGTAPEGAVLVFDSDLELGKRARNNGGGRYGHVEIVAESRDGERLYVSDAARRNAGGSVPQNFAGAYIYVGPNAPSSNITIANTYNAPGNTRIASSGYAEPAPVAFN